MFGGFSLHLTAFPCVCCGLWSIILLMVYMLHVYTIYDAKGSLYHCCCCCCCLAFTLVNNLKFVVTQRCWSLKKIRKTK